jgi:beta-mannanase
LAVALIVVGAAAGLSAPVQRAEAGVLSEELVPCAGTLLGVSQGPPRGGRKFGEESGFLEGLAARRFDLDRSYYAWSEGFPAPRDYQVVAAGRIPVISWIAKKRSGAVIPWRAIAAGRYDGIIESRADALRAFSHRVMFIFHHEADADLGTNGSPEDFAAAFRRVISIIRARGATNAKSMWTLTANTFKPGGRAPEEFYPGDDVVDWVAADGYNWYGSTHLRNRPWTEFSTIFAPFNQWAAARGKPAMIAETGVLEDRTEPPDPAPQG